ncbi:TPA: baseplate J/gp47 family protein [Campylobacter jejuni]|nr:baseplate J/gp47 family protein [Campylobacter jejuni]HDV7513967.1 baseplate J/gp47 family protein [Campylobacter jejuni]HDV7520719.1 baseplate J/gp47 family protein [Campylobacter jejuni]HED5389960.1 baseplate J/gp47 family protein [Campylobacter jejuni]HED5393449.1 baseplate J/gp47 family protein [Campylobacter jejuni]
MSETLNTDNSYFKQSFLKDIAYPKIIEELDFEKLLKDYEELFKSFFKESVELLESDPFKAVLEALAYREMIIRARINESIKATYLHYASGSDLDNVVANGYLITRLQGVKPTAKVEFELNTLLNYDVIIPKGAIFSNEKAEIAVLKEDVIIKKDTAKAEGILELDEFVQSKDTKTEFLQTPLPFVAKIKQLSVFSGGASEESDEALRERAIMSVHRFSTAGSEKGYIYHALSASAKVASIKALNNGAGKVRVIIKSEDENTIEEVQKYLSADEVRPLTDEVSVELAKKREFIIEAKLLLLELSRANEISEKINALQKDFDLSVDLALGFIYKCLHQDGVYKSEILSIKERITNEENEELKNLPLENILIADDEFASLAFELSYEKALL